MQGSFSGLFLGVEIIIGSLIPLLILILPFTRTVVGVNFASLLVMVGIFTMRYVVVIAGQWIPQI